MNLKAKERRARYQEKHERLGLCQYCPKPADGTHSRCDSCRKKHAAACAKWKRSCDELGKL